jgi:hypothetical protein
MMASQIVAPEDDWMDRYERFTWMAWEWNVTGAKAILRDHPERVEYASMEQLANATHGLIRKDPDWVREMPDANLDRPLIFAQLYLGNRWQQLLIDGHHRLEARHTRGRTDQVPCFVLSQAESKRLYCGVGGKRSPYWKVQVER